MTPKQGFWTLAAVLIVITILFGIYSYYVGSQVDF